MIAPIMVHNYTNILINKSTNTNSVKMTIFAGFSLLEIKSIEQTTINKLKIPR